MNKYEKNALLLHFPHAVAVFDENDDVKINIDGVLYDYEMTLSPAVPDAFCQRIKVGRKYYYFSTDMMPWKF